MRQSDGTEPRRSRWSLRAYFAALAIGITVVGSVAGIYVYVQAAVDAEHLATNDSAFAAHKAGDQLNASLKFIHDTLGPIASAPSSATLFATPEKCVLGYDPQNGFDTGHIDIIRPDGSIVCSSRNPAATGKPYAGQGWLTAAAPTDSAPVRDLVTGKLVAITSFPMGKLGVIAWFSDLELVGSNLAREFGSGINELEFIVLAADGKTILSRSIHPSRWAGATTAGTGFSASATMADRPDVEGVERLYGTSTVASTGWKVYVGADKSVALTAAARLQQRELAIIVVGLLAVLVALLTVYRSVVRPITALDTAVKSSRGLDFTTEVPVIGPSEVAALGENINSLTASLKRELGERISAQRTYERLFEASPLPMTVSDPLSGMFIEVNESAVKAFGYSKDEFKSMATRELYMPADEAERRDLDDMQARTTETHARYGPASFHKKDGSVLRAVVTAYRVDFAGKPAWVAMIEDVTAKEKIEQQHQQAQRLESLGQLAGGVAHDFNNLLAVILNVTAHLKSEMHGAADAERDLKRIEKAAQSASRLTRQLLAFARREVVQPVVMDVNEQITALTELLGRTLGSHVRLTTTLQAGLWRVEMDTGQLEQVVINLAVNARDAMPKGGVLTLSTANVIVDEVSASKWPGVKSGRYAMVEVSDTGTGMAQAALDHAFEPFFTTKALGQGTGLGLATVYGIVQGFGGHVSIDSQAGRGTKIVILIPATDEQLPAAPGAPASVPAVHGSATVLLVEDNEDLRELIEEILRDEGYDVLTARDGKVGLDVSREHAGKIDVLLSDVVMPNMLGPDLAEQMRAENPGLRVLFMSGHAQPLLGTGTFLSAEASLIQKPFMAPELLERLAEVLAAPAQADKGDVAALSSLTP